MNEQKPLQGVSALAAERAARLKAAREKQCTPHVPLNASGMRTAVEELVLPGGNEVVGAIGKAFQQCFAGITTPRELYKSLEKLVGQQNGPENQPTQSVKSFPLGDLSNYSGTRPKT